MYEFTRSTRFKRDVKRCQKQNKSMAQFKNIHEKLVKGEPLPRKNKAHNLSGNWNGYRECHIEPDWLLIYRVDEENKIIEYTRMGTHSDLFK
jgi:mRNA interferase YafQ